MSDYFWLVPMEPWVIERKDYWEEYEAQWKFHASMGCMQCLCRTSLPCEYMQRVMYGVNSDGI